jgi:diguanylate cyclase (GGDEF)-like protein
MITGMAKSVLFGSITLRMAVALLLTAFTALAAVAAALWFGHTPPELAKTRGAAVKQLIDLKSERLMHGLVAISDAQALAGLSKSSIASLDAEAAAQLTKRLQIIVSLDGADFFVLLDGRSGQPMLWSEVLKANPPNPPKLQFSRTVEPLTVAKSTPGKGLGFVVVENKVYATAARTFISAESNEKFILIAASKVEKILADDQEIRSLSNFAVSFKSQAQAAVVVAQSGIAGNAKADLAAIVDGSSHAGWAQSNLLSEPGMLLTVHSQSENTLVSLFNMAMTETLTAVALIAAACAALGWFWGRRIAAPIKSIQSGIKRLTEGDYKQISGLRSSLEITHLAESFNLMAEGMRQREKGILNVAYRDPLTQLPNRSLFSTRLQDAISRYRSGSKGVTTLLLDIDNFTMINDSFGQAAGDEILKEAASRFKQVLRNADSLLRVEAINTKDGNLTIARMGSSDFCILLQNCDSEQARKVALRLKDALEQPFAFRGQVVEAISQIGIASFPEHAADSVGLMSCADAALAKAKLMKGSICVFDPEAEKQREQQLSLLIDLKRSLERDELLLVFQPRVSLSEKAPLMVEALMRWEHPERGLINPNDFVPFAEKTGFITHMTRWVIDTSLKQINAWQKEGISVEVSVNVSLRDLSDKDFPTFVVSKLRAHKIAPQRLTLEVPDKVLSLGYERILPQLKILSGVGVRIAVDDFSGGFNSLHYLKEIKATSAKIDRAFVNEFTKDKSRAILVSSVIALSHSMKMSVVAQGVEDNETMALLKRLKCDFAQGYYFGKPLKAAEYRRWVQHQADKFQAGKTSTMSEV